MSSNAGCPSHMSICRGLVVFEIRSGRHVAGGDMRAGRDNADIRVLIITSSVVSSTVPATIAAWREWSHQADVRRYKTQWPAAPRE